MHDAPASDWLSIAATVASVLLLVLPLALAHAAWAWWRETDRATRARALAAAAALFATAFAARWWIPLHAVIHENHHGYAYLAATEGSPDAPTSLHGAASAHLTLLQSLLAVVPASWEPAFFVDAALSALGVLGALALGAAVSGHLVGGCTAAALLLLQPLSLMLAPTEEPTTAMTGATLCGMALVVTGARVDARTRVAAGTLLLLLTALARDSALPLAALIPLTLAGAPWKGPPRATLQRAAVATLACALLCVPQLLAMLAENARRGGAPDFVGFPHLPFGGDAHPQFLFGRLLDAAWVGWKAPFIPRWMGAVMCLGWLGWTARCLVARDLRGLALASLAPAVAVLQGGLVRGGWFPSALRHTQVSMALLLLPAGALAGRLALRHPTTRYAALIPVTALLAGVVTLLRDPSGARLDRPITREYAFFARAVAALPPNARVVPIERADVPPIAAAWFAARRPGWSVAEPDAPAGPAPTYLMIDRFCAHNALCIRGPSTCAARRAEAPAVATAFGRMHPACASRVNAARWREVARAVVPDAHRGDPFMPFDFPTLDGSATLRVLQRVAP